MYGVGLAPCIRDGERGAPRLTCPARSWDAPTSTTLRGPGSGPDTGPRPQPGQYATILDDELTLTDRAKADLMGQAKFLKDTYVSRGELHPHAAVFLDAALR
jgi:hypothetical protein